MLKLYDLFYGYYNVVFIQSNKSLFYKDKYNKVFKAKSKCI